MSEQCNACQQHARAGYSGGMWAGSWIMKTAAIVLKRNIITIAPTSLYLFTCNAPSKKLGYGAAAMKPYPATYGKIQQDLPVEALSEDTWFLIYDGSSHYWPAVRACAPHTQAHLQKEGFILDCCSNKHVPYATRRSVRINEAA